MARKRKATPTRLDRGTADAEGREAEVRIVGGEFRGRRLSYLGDPGVRPMKHRTREAIFNLISTECKGRHAIDLFSGSGALGLEAISRGATAATLIEKHVPTARIIEENIRTLAAQDRATLLITSAFLWAKRDLTSKSTAPPSDKPWVVFCCPPYAFYHERTSEMLELIERIQAHVPSGSLVVVEADEPFDFEVLRARAGDEWDIRTYPPAVVGIWRAPDM